MRPTRDCGVRLTSPILVQLANGGWGINWKHHFPLTVFFKSSCAFCQNTFSDYKLQNYHYNVKVLPASAFFFFSWCFNRVEWTYFFPCLLPFTSRLMIQQKVASEGLRTVSFLWQLQLVSVAINIIFMISRAQHIYALENAYCNIMKYLQFMFCLQKISFVRMHGYY